MPTDDVIAWLLASPEPAVRRRTRDEVLGQEAARDPDATIDGPLVLTLLSGQRPDGGFGVHPYLKWTGGFWRLVSLADLGVGGDRGPAVALARHVLRWVHGAERRTRWVAGRARQHALAEGFTLGACCRLGMATDPQVASLAERLVEWQWPDGGWNCDPRPVAHHSSFHESLAPMWGLWEYAEAAGDQQARASALRASALLLDHRVYQSRRTGKPVHPSWVMLHYPPYWHYDVLAGMSRLTRMGLAGDPRAAAAVDLLERRRQRDGRWRPGGYWWRPLDSAATSNTEVVDWGRGGPNRMVTLQALGILRAAGRLTS